MFYRLFYPRQTCMLSVQHEDKSNITVVDWVSPASLKPPMVAVAINNKSYSLELVSSSKAFVLSILPESMQEKAIGVGSATGRVIDKVDEYQLKLKKAKTVKAPLLDGALAWVECEVVAIFNAGDHSIVLGEVVETQFPEEEATKTPMLFNWGNKNYFGMKRDQFIKDGKEERKEGREESKSEKKETAVREEMKKENAGREDAKKENGAREEAKKEITAKEDAKKEETHKEVAIAPVSNEKKN